MFNQLHSSVLEFAENYRLQNPDFKYALRKANRKNRFEDGLWFQGTEKYVFLGLINRSGGTNMTKSFGLVFRPKENDVKCDLEIVYNEERDKKILKFYSRLRESIGGFEKIHETKFKKTLSTDSGFEAATQFLNNNWFKIQSLINEMELQNILITNEDFNENLTRIKEFQLHSGLYDNSNGSGLHPNSIQFWLIAPGQKANMWNKFYTEGIMAIGWHTGDLRLFKSQAEVEKKLESIETHDKDHRVNAQQCFEFAHHIKLDDIIIAKKGMSEYLGWGVVTKEYSYHAEKNDYQHVVKVNWKANGTWEGEIQQRKTVTNITKNPKLSSVIKLLNIVSEHSKGINHTLSDFSAPLNLILYGPPGTGKTYHSVLKAAEIIEKRRIDSYLEAKKIFNTNLHDQIEFITFHQNYSYEDFIQGLRPEVDNNTSLAFKKVDGVFKVLADKAMENLLLSAKDPDELSKDQLFDIALEKFIEEVQEAEPNYKINNATFIMEVEEDAFRYTGENWNRQGGGRMKFKDLKEFYRNNVSNRKDIKALKAISPLAKHHATYYFLVYQKLLKHIPKESEIPSKVERKNYILIIDEINRANISRVFGELITLIEPDKRYPCDLHLEAKLPSGDKFSVPENLYIIGTMNTADKSIALLDIALRRRFEFKSMYPNYAIDDHEIFDLDVLKALNNEIVKTKGHDFQIGHAYFMKENKELIPRMNNKVIPLLMEYYMNDKESVVSILSKAGLEIDSESWPIRITGRRG